MTQFLGEYDCKIDAKGRMRLPSQLIKQFDGLEQSGFVMNRGFEKCLTLYPKIEWDKITKELGQLNQYVKKNRNFIRYFFRGATELNIDNSDRILIKKNLKDYANINKDVVITCFLNKIEIWAAEEYGDLLEDEPMEFADLAEDVMGNINV
jgi:MraZ protein